MEDTYDASVMGFDGQDILVADTDLKENECREITIQYLSLIHIFILLVIAFLISPMGLPTAAAWLLGKVQGLRYAIQDRIYR